MNFCSECNNILYPRNQDNKLIYFCKNCRHSELAANPLVYRKVISGGQSTQAKTRNYNIILDPTLPRMKNLACPQCGNLEPVYYQTSEEAMSLTFVCQNRQCVFQGQLEDFKAV